MGRRLIPSSNVPFVGEDRKIEESWLQYLAVNQPGPIAAVAVGASPFSYTAAQNGTLSVVGGVVSAITLQRAATVLATGLNAGLLPMAQGDIAKITYTGLPTVTWIPSE